MIKNVIDTKYQTKITLRTLFGMVACSALCLLSAAACGAQTGQADYSRASATLDQIARLIDGIHARQASPRPADAGIASDWRELFDGKTLTGWQRTNFDGGGSAAVVPDFHGAPAIVVEAGSRLSGINWTGDAPRMNYEITLEAMKVDGQDFMCGLTFPVGSSYASLILGGWGGTVVGVSSINGQDASDNETSRFMSFDRGRWYAVRLRVLPGRLQAWVDGKSILDYDTSGKRLSLRAGEISKSVPIGLSNFQTKSAFRAVRLRSLVSQ